MVLGGSISEMGDFDASTQFYELPFIAVKRLLDEHGLRRGDLDFVITSSYDYLDGRMISNMYTTMASGGYLRYESRVSDDSLLALAYANMKILSGEAEIGIAVSYAAQETDMVATSNLVFDPFHYRPVGMNYLSGLALQASSYLHESGIAENADAIASQIVSAGRRAGALNPRAHLRTALEPKDYIDSEYVIWPLREKGLTPHTRGAAAILLAEEHVARRLGLKPLANLEAINWGTDSYYLGSKNLYSLPTLAKAVRDSLTRAGIEDLGKEVQVFEISDVTPFHYLMELEALGLSQEKQASALVENGEVGPRGLQVIVNPSGGSLCTDPYPAGGLVKLYEAYLQVIHEAGPVQVEDVGRALVHGFSYISGASAPTHVVAILSGG